MSESPVYLCRCECVTVEFVDQSIAEGNLTINDIKRRTRAGMGICQGIYCASEMAAQLIAAGVDPTAIEPMTSRPPARLLSLTAAASTINGKAR